MNNRELTAKIVHHMTGDLQRAHDVSEELTNAGLLAPDLPEPRIDIDGWQVWGHKHDNQVSLQHGMVTVVMPDDISRDLTIKEARDLANALYAAANYSEEGNRE